MLKLIRKITDKYNQLSLLVFMLLPLEAFAGTTKIEEILSKATTFLQGGLAKSVGLLAVIGTGYLCIVKQRFPKEQFAMVLLGLGVIFGSSSLYNTLVG
jgi:type IV secretion system protein VirB2